VTAVALVAAALGRRDATINGRRRDLWREEEEAVEGDERGEARDATINRRRRNATINRRWRNIMA
jgi:hypothetical protein